MAENTGLILDSISHVLTLCSTIYKMAMTVKSNKKRCQQVAQRVKSIEELVLTIKGNPRQISSTVITAVNKLINSLNEAVKVMSQFSRTKTVGRFLQAISHEDKFNEVNQNLSDDFQFLSGALQIEHGNLLYKVYDTVKVRTKKEEATPAYSLFSIPATSPAASPAAATPFCCPNTPPPPDYSTRSIPAAPSSPFSPSMPPPPYYSTPSIPAAPPSPFSPSMPPPPYYSTPSIPAAPPSPFSPSMPPPPYGSTPSIPAAPLSLFNPSMTLPSYYSTPSIPALSPTMPTPLCSLMMPSYYIMPSIPAGSTTTLMLSGGMAARSLSTINASPGASMTNSSALGLMCSPGTMSTFPLTSVSINTSSNRFFL